MTSSHHQPVLNINSKQHNARMSDWGITLQNYSVVNYKKIEKKTYTLADIISTELAQVGTIPRDIGGHR